MKTTRIARRLGLDGNPLRRRTDKIAARLAALLLAVFLIGAPFLSAAAVGWAGHHSAADLRAQRSWHQVSAVLLQGVPAPTATSGVLGYYHQVLARWTTPDGRARTGRIPVSTDPAAGRTVRLWVDSAGSPTGPPPNLWAVLTRQAAAAVVATSGLGIVLLCLAWAGGGYLTSAGSPTGKRDGLLSVLSGPGASGRGASRGNRQTRQVMRAGGRR